uniref:Uncharacterized protein n=1 Tax=Tanacetum cinerariifolium TaxID=118510 RepID=A0A6L2MLQ2_TANCI|nr:hypothetical protein [Tanacetum cinerariifolium]
MPSKNKTTIDYSNTSNSNFLRFNFLLYPESDEGRIRALDQETWKLDLESKQMKDLKASYDITTPRSYAVTKLMKKLVITTVMALVAKLFYWNEESLSSKDEGVTRVKAFTVIAKDEPVVGKADARSAHNLPLQNEITILNLDNESLRDEVSDLQKVEEEPLPPLPKLSGAKPIGTSNDAIPLADLIQTSTISDKTKQVTENKKKAHTKSSFSHGPNPNKKANSSTEQLILTLMQETLAKFKAQSSHATSSRKALKILNPFIPHKYYGFRDHHSNKYEYHHGCDIFVSVAHKPVDYNRKTTSNNRKPRIANQRSNKPTEK